MDDYEEYERYKTYKRPSEYDLVMGTNGNGFHTENAAEINPGIIKAIEKECGVEIAQAVLKITGPKLN